MEKGVFYKALFCTENGNIICISCSLWCTSYRNDIIKIFRMSTFEDFVKNKKFFKAAEKTSILILDSFDASLMW